METKNAVHPAVRSYLVRLWQEDACSRHPWRLVVIDLGTGTRRGFADFDMLVRFLRDEHPEGVDEISPGGESAAD